MQHAHFHQELMPVIEAVSSAQGVSENITAGLIGHIIFYDDETEELKVAPDALWKGARYFIPQEPPPAESGQDWVWGPANFGICANDLAREAPGMSADEYARAAATKNVLELVWRLEVDSDAGALAPSWPVVFLNRPVAFSNAEPMELGITYGSRYWRAVESTGC